MFKKEEKEVKCFFTLGDSYCQAPDSKSFDADGLPCSFKDRVCSKDIESCKRYHGNLERYGGVFSRE